MASNVPNLKTNRLILRNIKEEDAKSIVEWRSDPNIYCFFVSPHKITIEEHINWYKTEYLIDENRIDWMAVDNYGNLVGVFGIKRNLQKDNNAEISYILAPDKKGKGYATEAFNSIISFLCNNWKCDYVVAEIHENNIDSINFAIKQGMKFDSQKREFKLYKKQLTDKDIKKNNRLKFFIRADGNSTIGTGHIMRCLSIARKLRDFDVDIKFVLADESMSTVIDKSGFEFIVLDSSWDNLEEEIEELCSIIREEEVDAVIVDSYFITEEYLSKLRKESYVCYIDDFNKMQYPAEALINYNVYAHELNYNEKNYDALLLGTEYAPLRDEFENCINKEFKGIKKILITSGGTDEYNVVGKILDRIITREDFKFMDFYCIVGKFNKNENELKNSYNKYSNIHLIKNTPNIIKYMLDCDIAITAGGTTCYELCACGLPSIIYVLADNQLMAAEYFFKNEIMAFAGDIRCDIDSCLENINQEINRLMNKEIWKKQSKKMQALVDGNGAKRIAEILIDRLN